MVYEELNQEAIEQFRRLAAARSESFRMMEHDYLQGTDPTIPTKHSFVTDSDKMTKRQDDRSLRVNEWVGGYIPPDQPKRRTCKIQGDLPTFVYEDNYLFKNGME